MSVNRWLDSEISSGVSIKKMQSLVYEKDESDDLLLDKASKSDVYSKSEVYPRGDVDAFLLAKADNVDVYTKDLLYKRTDVDALLSTKPGNGDVHPTSEVDGMLLDKADRADVYTKADVDTLVYESKIENASVYTGSAAYHPPSVSEQTVEVRIPTKDGVFKATSSSKHSLSGPAEAFDYTFSTQWTTASSMYRTSAPAGDYAGDKRHHAGSLVGEWIGIEFPYRVNVSRFEIGNRIAIDAPHKFQIFGTNNDVDWFLLVYQGGITWESNEMSKAFFPQSNNDIPYKKFVLVINKNNGRNNSSIAKFVIHGGS